MNKPFALDRVASPYQYTGPGVDNRFSKTRMWQRHTGRTRLALPRAARFWDRGVHTVP